MVEKRRVPAKAQPVRNCRMAPPVSNKSSEAAVAVDGVRSQKLATSEMLNSARLDFCGGPAGGSWRKGSLRASGVAGRYSLARPSTGGGMTGSADNLGR